MCGINGMFACSAAAPRVDAEELVRTRDAMAARGPDGAGAWVAEDGRAALASRRLAILDLSPRGAQPMAGAAGRVQIAFNGEIYNFLELRAALKARGSTSSRCDTEVVLALYLRDGAAMLARLRGMFGLAIWDGRDADRPRLLLARDPFGIKPLYYSTAGGDAAFASQVKALTAGGAVVPPGGPGGTGPGSCSWGSVPDPLHHPARRASPAGRAFPGRRSGAPVRAAGVRRRAWRFGPTPRAARSGGRTRRGRRPPPPRRRPWRGKMPAWPRSRTRSGRTWCPTCRWRSSCRPGWTRG